MSEIECKNYAQLLLREENVCFILCSMQLHHPKGIAFVVLIAIISVGATLFVEARTKGSPNPVIEWVLIQPSSKTPGNAGVSITIQGYNFTATGNEVRTKNGALKSGLSAINGVKVSDPNSPGSQRFIGLTPMIITFELPAGVPCSQNEQCPISVANTNGVSNTVSFRLNIPQ